MSKKVQSLSRSRNDVYKDARPSGFGQRSPDFTTMGRKVDNQYAKHRDVVVVQACRTPYGRLGGKL
ncbi:MAG: acetyl-CoA C-acyltransferase, partial [Thermodesulfobacteriota bacterium]